MDTNQPGRNGPADERIPDDAGAEESPALASFIRAVGECAELLAHLRGRVDGRLGVPPEGVGGYVADARRFLHHLRHLRHAAFAAGVGEEPPR